MLNQDGVSKPEHQQSGGDQQQQLGIEQQFQVMQIAGDDPLQQQQPMIFTEGNSVPLPHNVHAAPVGPIFPFPLQAPPKFAFAPPKYHNRHHQPRLTGGNQQSYNYNKRFHPQPHWNNSFTNRNNAVSFNSPGCGSLRPRFDSPKTPQRYNGNNWNNTNNFNGGYNRNSPPMRRIAAVENFKTALCTQFNDSGHCRYGLHCRFAHGPEELRRQPMPFDPSTNDKYKTVLCKQYTRTGKCNYGQQCLFAHGEAELRPSQNSHNAKECYQ